MEKQTHQELPDVASQEQAAEALGPKQQNRVGHNVLNYCKRTGMYAAVGLAAMDAFPIAAIWLYSRYESGQYELTNPRVTKPVAPSNDIRILVWNTESANRSPDKDLRILNERTHPDFVLAQEVTEDTSRKMLRDFPGYYGIFAVGKNSLDTKAFGNMLLSRQPPRDIQSRSIDGTSLLETEARMNLGLFLDAYDSAHSVLYNPVHANASLTNTKDGLQESRDLIGATFKALDGNQEINTRIATTHISSLSDVGSNQLRTVVHLMGDTAPSANLTMVCGDFNIKPIGKIRTAFEKIHFITPDKIGSHAKGNGDYCSYTGPGVVTITALDLPDRPEHHPLDVTIKLPLPGPVSSPLPDNTNIAKG